MTNSVCVGWGGVGRGIRGGQIYTSRIGRLEQISTVGQCIWTNTHLQHTYCGYTLFTAVNRRERGEIKKGEERGGEGSSYGEM